LPILSDRSIGGNDPCGATTIIDNLAADARLCGGAAVRWKAGRKKTRNFYRGHGKRAAVNQRSDSFFARTEQSRVITVNRRNLLHGGKPARAKRESLFLNGLDLPMMKPDVEIEVIGYFRVIR